MNCQLYKMPRENYCFARLRIDAGKRSPIPHPSIATSVDTRTVFQSDLIDDKGFYKFFEWVEVVPVRIIMKIKPMSVIMIYSSGEKAD